MELWALFCKCKHELTIAARAELRDRGVKPEAGAAPVDPNIVTNKYYGENIDIISKVQEILFCKNLIKISENNDSIPFNDNTICMI
jgi:hypothetical protein